MLLQGSTKISDVLPTSDNTVPKYSAHQATQIKILAESSQEVTRLSPTVCFSLNRPTATVAAAVVAVADGDADADDE